MGQHGQSGLLVAAHAAAYRLRTPPLAQRAREKALDAWLRKRLCCDQESLFSSFSSESPRRLAAEGALWCRPRAADRTALAFHLGGMRPCLRLTRQVARSTRSRAPSSRTTTSMPPPAMGLAAHRGMARWSAALALAHSPSPSPEQLAVLLTHSSMAPSWRSSTSTRRRSTTRASTGCTSRSY